MAFDSRAYRILIASPSDVEDEREIAVKVIQQWNDLNSYSRNIVLLPLRWETHTAPEYNARPQEVINRAIVDDCDLLLGIFWTKIGTPTGLADSGTLEEIERVAAAGKPVMLYFSQVHADPYCVDSSQFERLKNFRAKAQQHALIESFKSPTEFRDKLAAQIEMKVRELHKNDCPGQLPSVTLRLASTNGYVTKSAVTRPQVEDLEVALSSDAGEVRDRIKAEIDRAVQRASEIPIGLVIGNTGSSGIRNLFVEVSVKASSDEVQVHRRSYAQRNNLDYLQTPLYLSPIERDDAAKDGPSAWSFEFEWAALQPQRTRVVEPYVYISAASDARVEFEAKVYADNFTEPLTLLAALEVSVAGSPVKVLDLLPNLDSIRKQPFGLGTYQPSLTASWRS